MEQEAELTFEIEETLVVKRGGYFIREYCPRCREVVDMVSPDVLSLATGASEREIFRLMEIGKIHFNELGRVVACPSCYGRLLVDQPQYGAELEPGGSDISETRSNRNEQKIQHKN